MRPDECPCSGKTLDRFLRPAVMAVLAIEPKGLHGYRIAQELQDVAIFTNDPPDSAGLYRALKAMETEGLLTSAWDTEGSGAAKRVYVLTGTGRDCLKRWVDTLESYSMSLQETVRFIKHNVSSSNTKEGTPRV